MLFGLYGLSPLYRKHFGLPAYDINLWQLFFNVYAMLSARAGFEPANIIKVIFLNVFQRPLHFPLTLQKPLSFHIASNFRHLAICLSFQIVNSSSDAIWCKEMFN